MQNPPQLNEYIFIDFFKSNTAIFINHFLMWSLKICIKIPYKTHVLSKIMHLDTCVMKKPWDLEDIIIMILIINILNIWECFMMSLI